ncbi:hypothetical protein HGRIS_007365 [Hohenbuehelia grisea]|uniref:Cyclin-like domain-containing protein n=1 Tax=Hohenbuehelia grisea TaxID=104357 RepID=A0ABR3J4Y7_9AGAR
MASLYTSPSLPRTPSHYAMNSAALPSLPLPQDFSNWVFKHAKHHLLTPPMTSTFEQRKMHLPPVKLTTTLPPIAHLQRQLPPRTSKSRHYRFYARVSDLPVLVTPPDEESPSSPSPASSSKLPPIQDLAAVDDASQSKPFMPADAPYLVDWLDVSRTRSAHFIAEKTCEMICYLWFSIQPSPSSPTHPARSPNLAHSPSYRPSSTTTTLQLVATPTFIQFMQKLLETTQVSQSVIVLSLHYIYRLKERNRFTAGLAGSEFRIAVAALMMANKFLDDNTYTNKTWSEVSGIDLNEINKMEREFLLGVDFNLYVDKVTYESWLNLLKGLVMAKERDSRQWRKSRGLLRISRLTNPQSSAGPASRTYSRHRVSSSHRARSTSPGQTTRSLAYPSNGHHFSAAPQPSSHAYSAVPDPILSSPTPKSGSKRTAEAAFSPTSASFSHLPAKRPVSMSLRIPEQTGATTPSHSPLESLQSFAKMSIASSPSANRSTPSAPHPAWHHSSPATLSTAYAVDEESRSSVPQVSFSSRGLLTDSLANI